MYKYGCIVAAVLAVVACHKKSNLSPDSVEQEVLSQSTFYPGETAPEPAMDSAAPSSGGLKIAAATGDTGFIPGGGSTTGHDGGVIAPPGSGNTSSNTSGTNSGTAGNTGGSSSGSTSGSTGVTGPTGGNTSTGSTTGSSGGSPTTGSNAGGSSSGATDGGNIPAPGTGTGNDGGNIGGSNVTGSTNTGGTSGASTASNTIGGTSNTSGSSAGGSNTGGSSSSSSSGVSSGSGDTGNVSTGGSTGANDGGVIVPPGSSAGNDGGNVAGGTGSSGSSSGSNNTSGSSSGNNNGTTVASNHTGSSSSGSIGSGDTGSIPNGGNSSGGNDGGVILSPGSSGSGDGGNTGTSGNTGSNTGSHSGGTSGSSSGHSGNTSNPSGNGSTVGSNSGGTSGSPDGGGINPSGNSNGNDTGHTGNGNSTQGNNGVGNGVDPQPSGNPPVNDGSGTGPGNPGNQGGVANNGGNNGNHSSGNNNNGGNSGCSGNSGAGQASQSSCTCQTKNKIKVTLSRVCSVRRSSSKALFFEDAKNPILTMEALRPKSSCKPCEQKEQQHLASVGVLPFLNRMLNRTQAAKLAPTKNAAPELQSLIIQSMPLDNVNLFDGRYTTYVNTDFSKMKEVFGSLKWRQVSIHTAVCDDTNRNGLCSDESPTNTLSVVSPTYSISTMPDRLLVDVWNGRYLTKAEDPELCEKQYSPIVLDLNGDGIKLTAPETGVRFDLNDDGNQVQTGWPVGSDDAFLFRDLNSNGMIDSGAELFGSATRLRNGNRAPNGFEALKELDSNGDNLITDEDSGWKDLLLWTDKNRNGVADRGEVTSLRRFHITALNLKYIDMMEIDPYGNQTRERSTFTRRINGKLKPFLMVDIWFNTLVSGGRVATNP